MTEAGTSIDEALQQLRALISDTVKAEQLRDQLTGLPNDAALSEFLSSAVDQPRPFWIAFVEVDYFKRVNDDFGYEAADGLLKAIARHLASGADFFDGRAQPYRAHGDEFFITGLLERDDDGGVLPRIAEALEVIRSSVRAIRLAAGKSKPMTCTVSIGWMTSKDGKDSKLDLTARNVRTLLERAVAEAKRRGRDQVVRYDQSMISIAIVDFRASCPDCQASFTAAVPRAKVKVDQIFCPNCGARSDRPAQPELPSAVIEVQE